jgi:protein-glutamine gamma-glutamyltransferase
MKPSYLLMFSGIMVWGWMNQAWFSALILILIVFLNLLIRCRWDFNRKQFYRFTDISAVLAVVFLAYGYIFQSDINPIFSLLKWSPVLFSPILFAQIYSTRNSLPIDALFYSMRGQQEENQKDIDFTLPFVAIAILSSAAANVQTDLYFIISVIIISLILWLERPEKTKILVWLLVVSISIGISHWGHNGLKQLYGYVQEKSVDWLSNWSSDPFKSTTSIGHIGELKLSDKIEFRVKGDEPLLLHQSSYDIYIGGDWYTSKRKFKPYNNKNTLPPEKQKKKQLEYFHSFGSDAILALPDGTDAIHGLEGSELQQTELGAVKIIRPPPKAVYQASYSGINESKDTKNDLTVPKQHKEWLQILSIRLKLQGKSPEKIASSIKNFFQNEYFYTLFTPNESNADDALKDFILVRKAGHCEYFAVASVLLLRYSGIPSRLANGYSMQEYDETLDMYVVRRRHSHAWAIAKINNSWQAVDSTPYQWLAMENENASFLLPLWDWFSRAFFRFNQWRAGTDLLTKNYVLLGLLFILVCYGGWLLYKGRKQLNQRILKDMEPQESNLYPGLDSELFILEQYLQEHFQQQNQVRQANESIYSWLKCQQDPNLESIVQLHYRYRFDPNGLSPGQREELKSRVTQWIEQHRLEQLGPEFNS